ATSSATAVQIPGFGVTVNVTSPAQVWLIELSAYFSLPAGGVAILDLTVDGVLDATRGSIPGQAGTGGGAMTCAKVYTVTGLSVGAHTFGAKAWYQGTAGCVIAATNTTI